MESFLFATSMAQDFWNSGLSVENAELDAQHITLHEIGRSIVDSIEQKASSEALCDLIADFLAMSKVHDMREESILRQNHCPSLFEHQQVHQQARDCFTDFLELERKKIADRPALASAVSQWMQHHISDNDLQVKNYLKTPTS